VRAFEILSLLRIGGESAVWNHSTIAAELTRQTGNQAAIRASRLYELARYAPPHETISSESLAEARRCLTVLGGATPR
jgi:hypothetical protein